VEGTLPVTPDSTLSVIVGGGGIHGRIVEGAFGGGGGGDGLYTVGGGGGRSAIQINGEDVVTAGGGGGYFGGGAATSFSGDRIQSTAFQAGWNNDVERTTAFKSYYGGGGSNTTGGCGFPYSGSKYQGGAVIYGGGGGGGYFGGGGSSYLSRLTTFSLSESGTYSNSDCNGKYSAYFDSSSCGGGGSSSTSYYGQNGLVVIRPLFTTYPPSVNHFPSPTSSPSSIYLGNHSVVYSFPFLNSVQSVTVPSDVTSIYVYMW